LTDDDKKKQNLMRSISLNEENKSQWRNKTVWWIDQNLEKVMIGDLE